MEQTNKGKSYLCASKYRDYQMINRYLLAIFLSKESQHCDGCSKKSLHSFINFPKKKKDVFHLWAMPRADGDSSLNVHLIPKEGLNLSQTRQSWASLQTKQGTEQVKGGSFNAYSSPCSAVTWWCWEPCAEDQILYMQFTEKLQKETCLDIAGKKSIVF